MFRKVNDFDGDGRADYAVTRNENGLKIWYVWQSTDGFLVKQWGVEFDHNVAGDYDGDGKTDFAVYREPFSSTTPKYTFWVLMSETNSLFYTEFTSLVNLGSQAVHQDYNGDGRTDPAVITGEFGLTRQMSVSYSGTGGGFTTSIPSGNVGMRIGDMDGDAIADNSYYRFSDNLVTIMESMTNTTRTVPVGVFADRYQLADFDGDGIGDLTVFRDSDGTWWWIRSSDNVVNAAVWGQDDDLPVPADYDGDGKTDFAVYREPTSFPPVYTFWILQSQTNTFVKTEFTTFGNFGSQAVPQDYNGDGRTDVGLVTGEFGLNRPLSILYSGTGGGFSITVPSGQVIARIGDTDGGGSADIAHHPLSGNLVTIRSMETGATSSVSFGVSNDQYQLADFDGDGIGDLTIWRQSNGTWWWIRSSDNVVNVATWGQNGDFAVPADYDGDGKTDLAIWRSGVYWILGSQDGVSVFNWGLSTDTPVKY
jgi:hypothetical protein